MNTNATDSIIANRYQILEQLGEGGSGITYHAKDLQTSEEVAIKILSLRQIQDWKKIDLFEREANILQRLNHTKIPKYIDYFIYDTGNNIYYKLESNEALNSLIEQGIEPDKFYIVQQLVKGKTLANLVESGWKPDEAEVKKIATQVLDILIYLQELIPPVTHRDIKPQNLIRQENGEIFLVDFGGVQDQFRQTTVGSSVVGTYGYMSPEQLKGGKTYPSTDLYGLGATLIYLLTGEHPSELPQKRLKIDFNNLVKISAEFRDWIDKLIEPNYQNRLPSARIALDVLEGKSKLQDNLTFQSEKPSYSSIKLVKTLDKLIINIPSALNRKHYNYSLALLGVGCCAILFLILLIFSISTYGIYREILCLVYGILLFCQILLLNIKGQIFVWSKVILLLLILLSFLTLFVSVLLLCSLFFYSIPILATFFTFVMIFKKNVMIFKKGVKFILLLLIPFLLLFYKISSSLPVSILILVSEIIWGEYFRKLIRELLFDTILEIKENQEIHIQQRLGFFLKQNRDINIVDNPISIIKNDFCRLLTREERQWLIQQLNSYKSNSQR